MRKILFVLGYLLVTPLAPVYGEEAVAPDGASDTLLSSKAMTVTAKEIPVDDATFRDVLTTAYSSSPALGMSEYESKAANEDVMGAKAGWGPEVSIGAGYDMEFDHNVFEGDNPDGVANPRLPNGYRQYKHTGKTSAKATLKQNIYAGGATTARIEMAKSKALGSQASYSHRQQNILLKATKAHLDVAKNKALTELHAGNVAVLQKRLEVAKARFEFGDLTIADVASTEAKLDKARSELTAAKAELENAKAAYRQEIGKNPSSTLSVPSVPTFLPESREKALELSLQNNPALRQMDAEIATAKAKLEGTYAGLKPQVDLTAQAQRALGTNWHNNSARGSYRNRSNVFAAGASLTLPLDVMGATQSQIRKAKYESAMKRIQNIYQRQDVLAKSIKAWETYKALESRIGELQSQVKATKIAVDTLTEGYLVGNNTTLEVLTAEQEYFTAQIELTRAKIDFLYNSFALAEAVGILTPENLGLNVRIFDGEKHLEDLSRWGVSVEHDQTEYSGESLLDLP